MKITDIKPAVGPERIKPQETSPQPSGAPASAAGGPRDRVPGGASRQAAAARLGLAGAVTLEALQSRLPVEGKRMSGLLAEVRALAAALAELDELNRMLGQRALSYVRAHLAVLSPKPAAYDRRGSGATVA